MELRVPGDKSITQRALIVAGLADGRSRIRSLLVSDDTGSAAAVLRTLGVPLPPLIADEVRIDGIGIRGLTPALEELDCGNSGTCARLMLGVLSGQRGVFTLTGDASLRGRPMDRVADPLRRMGAEIVPLVVPDRLPLRVRGGSLAPLDHRSPVASAQVKSALLLAAVTGGAPVRIVEPATSRDHTERMLRQAGVHVDAGPAAGGWRVSLPDPPERLEPVDVVVPGDPSSAAFLLVLAALGGTGDAELAIHDVGLNPTRTGILAALRRMGASVEVEASASGPADEPRGTLLARASSLTAVEIGSSEVPLLIDEIPVLAVAAARAQGTTRITGARELRVKETDRLRALAENLRAVGVEAEELDDGLVVRGGSHPLVGRIQARGDHRIAMAFGVLGALPGNRIEVDQPAAAGVSFPGFWSLLERVVGAATGRSRGAEPRRPAIVTIDGPAGSGKSSTAREVARRLGYRHLDSGALYRGITFALLEDGVAPDAWPKLTADDLGRYAITLTPADGGFEVRLDGKPLREELRSPGVTAHVSKAARLPAVRKWLLDRQREAGAHGGLVADGRDMGSVVFPEADVKVFLTAALTERARRRLLQDTGREPTAEEVGLEAGRIAARDRADSEREASPLRRPDGAVILDTTALSMEEQVQRVVELVRG